MPIIRPYVESDRENWDAYVNKHPEGSVFHRIAWKHSIERTFNHKSVYLVAEDEGSKDLLLGVLPLFQIKSFLFGNYITSIPFAELGGVLADDSAIRSKLMEHAIEIAEGIGCDYLELRNRNPAFDLPTKSLYFNFRKELFPDADQNMNAIPRKARRMIRQGYKLGLTSEFGNHQFRDFYEIMAKSYHNLGTPIFSRAFFRNFLKTFDKNVLILVIRTKDNTPVAGVMTFFFKDQVLPYYAGSLFEYRALAPNDFMYWELMRYGCEHQYHWFDFGRSKKNTGSFDFKRHWGFEPVQLAYQYRLIRSQEMPNLSPSNPKFQKKIELWKRLPLPITKIIGPPIARYLA